MARDTDRKHVSEAFRTQPLRNDGTALWKRGIYGQYGSTGGYTSFTTEYAECLVVRYGPTGRITNASYVHYDEHGRISSRVIITQRKRKTVLHLLRTGWIL